MMDNPKASVIIPTYRRPALLKNTVASLAAQETAYDFEIVVVNDAPEVDLSFLNADFPGVGLKVICPERNVGRAMARNMGVRNSGGEIIIFLDDDMTVVSNFIEAHVGAHTEPGMAVIGNIESAPQYAKHPLAMYIERQGVKKRKKTNEINARCFRTGNGSLSRSLFNDVGMFDESFSTYGEDLDLAMRLEEYGVKFFFAREAVSYNHHPPDLEDMLEKLREWGRYTLPIVAERHPHFAEAIWLDLATPVEFGRESLLLSLRKMAVRVVLFRPFYLGARAIYRLTFLGKLLFPVIDYIRLHAYFNAYRVGLRENSPLRLTSTDT